MNDVTLVDVNLFYYMTTANLILTLSHMQAMSIWPEPVHQQVIFTELQWL